MIDTTYNLTPPTQDKPESVIQTPTAPAPAPDPYQNDPYRWDGDDGGEYED